jgi:hypothetical protein
MAGDAELIRVAAVIQPTYERLRHIDGVGSRREVELTAPLNSTWHVTEWAAVEGAERAASGGINSADEESHFSLAAKAEFDGLGLIENHPIPILVERVTSIREGGPEVRSTLAAHDEGLITAR